MYKYRFIDSNTKDMLKNNYLYFPTPSQLDDPFEGFLNKGL